MLEEFCEKNHCDQYIHSPGGSFPQCLMVQRELSRVSACPLRYDRIVVKAIPEEKTVRTARPKASQRERKDSSSDQDDRYTLILECPDQNFFLQSGPEIPETIPDMRYPESRFSVGGLLAGVLFSLPGEVIIPEN